MRYKCFLVGVYAFQLYHNISNAIDESVNKSVSQQPISRLLGHLAVIGI